MLFCTFYYILLTKKVEKEKIMKKLLSLLLVVVLTFSLVGCGNSNSAKDLAGNYKAVSVKANGQEVDLSTLESAGMSVSLTIEEDGNGTMEFSGQKIELVFDADDMKVKSKDDKDGVLDFTFENDKLSFGYEGTEFSFEKE